VSIPDVIGIDDDGDKRGAAFGGVSRQLAQASINTTANIYAHGLPTKTRPRRPTSWAEREGGPDRCSPHPGGEIASRGSQGGEGSV